MAGAAPVLPPERRHREPGRRSAPTWDHHAILLWLQPGADADGAVDQGLQPAPSRLAQPEIRDRGCA
ncbi:hypothetical protein G6F46_015444 [Rhizopus delemar]|nr:hypothetical protein G6F46_015444 [Rhizopus delemar]